MKKTNFGALLVFALAVGLIFAACDTGTGGGGSDTDEYQLEWSTFSGSFFSFSDILALIAMEGLNVQGDSQTYALATGATAREIYSRGKGFWWDDLGTETGSFENLVNYTNSGIGAPSGLKSLMRSNKANVPLLGIFDIGPKAVIFYITK
jgi:hypothetical protein